MNILKMFSEKVDEFLYKGNNVPTDDHIVSLIDNIYNQLKYDLPSLRNKLNYIRVKSFTGKEPKTNLFMSGRPIRMLRIYDLKEKNQVHALFGILEESIEILDAWADYSDVEKLEDEIGDLLWFIQLLINDLGLDMKRIMEKNIEKLTARVANKEQPVT